ncbi:acyl-[acyl-carrier-protein] thioesterase [Hathewaya histolytica]|uniref:acyl-[acyl-carrier-protein] thioesterase n=1 Tax=Hathewaya histolytica TaxID=1498 RepID=UPI003B68400A
MEGIVTDKTFEVNFHEIDYKKRALFTSIMQYFEDVSMEQSEKLGIGLEYLKENNIAWILYKWDIKVNRYPSYGEKIVARTIPCGCRKFYAYRNFEIIDSSGEVIVLGHSIWFLVDINRGKPKRVTEELQSKYGLDGVKKEPFTIEKINLQKEDFDYKKLFDVRYSDIDTNLHVNNVKYISWILETIPLDIILEYNLKRLTITYEKEVKYGDKINVYGDIISREDDVIVFEHKIDNSEGNRVTIGKTYWSK